MEGRPGSPSRPAGEAARGRAAPQAPGRWALGLFVEFTSISRGAGRLHASVLLKKKRVPTAQLQEEQPGTGRETVPAFHPRRCGVRGWLRARPPPPVSPVGIGHKSTLCSATRAPRPPLTPHVFRSSNTPPCHPREATGNPGHTPNARRQGVRCPVSEASVQGADACAGPSPGLSGSRGGTGKSSRPPPGLPTFLSPLSPQAAPG